MRLTPLLTMFALALSWGVASAADKPADSWDGLVAVKSKRMDAAYVAPGADFKPYDKLMIDPTEVSFHPDGIKNMNDRRDLSRMVDEGPATSRWCSRPCRALRRTRRRNSSSRRP